MEVQLCQDTHRKTYRVTFEDGELEPRPVPYSRTERTYAPMAATLVVWRDREGPWSVSSVDLSGRAHKKDGTVGLQHTEEQFYSSDRAKQPKLLTDAVAAILDELNAKV